MRPGVGVVAFHRGSRETSMIIKTLGVLFAAHGILTNPARTQQGSPGSVLPGLCAW